MKKFAQYVMNAAISPFVFIGLIAGTAWVGFKVAGLMIRAAVEWAYDE